MNLDKNSKSILIERKKHEDEYVIKNTILSKSLYRFVLDELPNYKDFNKMTYQDKFLIIKNNKQFSEFTEYFPIVVREMIFNFYHDKAFKKFVRYLYNYIPSAEDRVILTSKDKMKKMQILNAKNGRYLYYLHYYRTNKKSKDKSEDYYNLCLKELNNDSKIHYDDYLEILEKTNKDKELIKERYYQEILKELKL
jgi:hypothetical protein